MPYFYSFYLILLEDRSMSFLLVAILLIFLIFLIKKNYQSLECSYQVFAGIDQEYYKHWELFLSVFRGLDPKGIIYEHICNKIMFCLVTKKLSECKRMIEFLF